MNELDALLEQLWLTIGPFLAETLEFLQQIYAATPGPLLLGVVIGSVVGAVFSKLIRGLLSVVVLFAIVVVALRALDLPLPALS